MMSHASWPAQSTSSSWLVPTGQRTCLSAEFQLHTSVGFKASTAADATVLATAQPLNLNETRPVDSCSQPSSVLSNLFEVTGQAGASPGASICEHGSGITGIGRVSKRLCSASSLTVQLAGHQTQQDTHKQGQALVMEQWLGVRLAEGSIMTRSDVEPDGRAGAIQGFHISECLKEFMKPEAVHWACPKARVMSVPVPAGTSSEAGESGLSRSASFKKQASEPSAAQCATDVHHDSVTQRHK
jgi:hypothetical protein